MEWYSRSKEDFRELLYAKYKPMEENVLWCLGDWAENTDYVLCNGDSDLLPPLVKKDEIRFSYNQYKNKRSYVSCTIFAAVWMLSDLMNYEFSYDEIKEIDELSYERWRIRGQWWYVQSAVKLVADRWNEKMDRKVAYYRLSKFDNEIIEDVIGKLYTIDWNMHPTKERGEDKKDWMIDGTDFGTQTNWHSVGVVSLNWQRSVKDSWSMPYYWLKNKLSAISNFWANFYVYVPVGDNLEEIKRLNELKTECLNCITSLWNIRHMTNDKNFQWVLHYTADKLRAKVKDCDDELKKYT
jgi:hypothetical protein